MITRNTSRGQLPVCSPQDTQRRWQASLCRLALAAFILLGMGGCAKLQFESPDKPVVIDVHVRIDLEEHAKRLLET